VAPRLELHGSVPIFLRRRLRNWRLLERTSAVYVYAGRGNAGDYLSHLGVRNAVALPGLELLAGEPGNRELARTLGDPRFARRPRVLLIGGGGLFQECFREFWRVVLESDLPYAIFGVGANRLGEERSITGASLLADVVRGASFVVVRDEMTRDVIAASGIVHPVDVGLCPSTGYLFPRWWRDDRSMNRTLLHVVHPSDLWLAGGDLGTIRGVLRDVASEQGLRYEEQDNLSADLAAVLRKYAEARVVVSSRLHGCIVSHATGAPFLPVRCDDKIGAFLRTHAPKISPVDVHVLQDRAACNDAVRRTLDGFDPSYRSQVERGVQWNAERGREIREAIATRAWKRVT
jgi:hypothetical protein